MHVRIENRNSEPVVYEVFTFKPAGPTCGGSGLNRTYRVGVRFFIGSGAEAFHYANPRNGFCLASP